MTLCWMEFLSQSRFWIMEHGAQASSLAFSGSKIESAMDDHKGWHSRGYLPHLDAGDVTQFITFRLGDSVPQEVLDEWEYLKNKGPDGILERYEKIESYLDCGSGSCILGDFRCSQIVHDAIRFLHGKRYELISWVIMPNHVHLLARFDQGHSLSKAMHSLKSYTSNELGKIYPEIRPIWQAESFDRYIRGEDHYERTIRYIRDNPVKANLCKMAESYPWGSEYYQPNE